MRLPVYQIKLDGDIPILVTESFVYWDARTKMNNADKVSDFSRNELKLHEMYEEYVYLIMIKADCTPTGVSLLAKGGVTSATCEITSIFIRTLLSGAISFIIVHNHPSGSIEPSKEDRQIAERIRQASEILGVQFQDFIIIGGLNQISFREEGLLTVNKG